jgi:hypothetical protein
MVEDLLERFQALGKVNKFKYRAAHSSITSSVGGVEISAWIWGETPECQYHYRYMAETPEDLLLLLG